MAPSRPFKGANWMLPLIDKSFLVLFFKKEHFSFFYSREDERSWRRIG